MTGQAFLINADERELKSIEIRANIADKLNSGENYLIVAVGDSITWGLNHCNADETYCAELARLVADSMPDASVIRYDGLVTEERSPLGGYSEPVTVQKGNKGTLTLVKSGVGGDTVRRAINRFDDYAGAFINGEMPDLFLLMFGINDALISDSDKFVSPDVFYRDYAELCRMLKKSNPTAELVLITPTYNDEGRDTVSSLDPYSKKVIELAEKTGLKYIDLHMVWMEHLVVGSENYGQRDWLSGTAGDFCHFSQKGASETARYLFLNL